MTNRDEAAAIELLFRLMRDIETNVRDWATFALASQTDLDSPEIRRALTERLGDSDHGRPSQNASRSELLTPALLFDFAQKMPPALLFPISCPPVVEESCPRRPPRRSSPASPAATAAPAADPCAAPSFLKTDLRAR